MNYLENNSDYQSSTSVKEAIQNIRQENRMFKTGMDASHWEHFAPEVNFFNAFNSLLKKY